MRLLHELFLLAGISSAIFFSSCATTHPNEKLLYGEWKPLKAEHYLTAEDIENARNKQNAGNPQNQPSNPKPGTSLDPKPGSSDLKSGKPGMVSGTDKPIDAMQVLKRMIEIEGQTNLIIYPDKTAVKFYPRNTVKATWKLKQKGTLLIAKDIQTKETYPIEILEISNDKIVVVETLPVGSIKILYQKK